MELRTGGGWFVLAIHRPDKKNLVLDEAELQRIPPATMGSITSKMNEEGLRPVVRAGAGWETMRLHDDFWPGTVPQAVHELAKYVPSGTVITFDNGCLPSIEWRFRNASVDVFDVSDN